MSSWEPAGRTWVNMFFSVAVFFFWIFGTSSIFEHRFSATSFMITLPLEHRHKLDIERKRIPSFHFRKDRGPSSLIIRRMKDSTDKAALEVVVIGGGWAGFSAANALASCKENVKIKLMDASPRGPGGLAGGWQSKKLNRTVEAGIHGFWREYRNTFQAIDDIGLSMEDILTDYLPSLLISKNGRVALAPVLGESNVTINNDRASNLFGRIPDELPAPLDIALLADFSGSQLTVSDRLSALGLLKPWIEFGQEDRDSWMKYDKISAENLFLNIAGVSQQLYTDLVSPLLHVLPMTPGYDCSAAAALSCFHVFALQSKGAFDVRWCRGSITEKIFNPWVEKLVSTKKVKVLGGTAVQSIMEGDDNRFQIQIQGGNHVSCDAVVLAVGGIAAARLAAASDVLQELPCTTKWGDLRGITCVAVRLFISRADGGGLPPDLANAVIETPVTVCGPNVGGIPELIETGFCIYDLQRLQDTAKQDNDVCAIEIDFFRADDLAALSDEEVLSISTLAVSSAFGISKIDQDLVADYSVVRARRAVSHFCLGSASSSPPVRLSKGLYISGDWVDRTGHASWSTEKAVVTGKQAALALSEDFGLICNSEIIPAQDCSPILSTLRKIPMKNYLERQFGGA